MNVLPPSRSVDGVKYTSSLLGKPVDLAGLDRTLGVASHTQHTHVVTSHYSRRHVEARRRGCDNRRVGRATGQDGNNTQRKGDGLITHGDCYSATQIAAGAPRERKKWDGNPKLHFQLLQLHAFAHACFNSRRQSFALLPALSARRCPVVHLVNDIKLHNGQPASQPH